MKRRNQSNRALLEKHKQELASIEEKMAAMTARKTELLAMITEEENVEIVNMVRAGAVTLEDLRKMMEGQRNSVVPVLMAQPTDKEEIEHENDE
ncbi:MAG: DUF4315 family protein [Clostridia bacterium]|jgi:hypothetical protein|nr:DUF4315 family protein [Clostridia bacterium]